MTEKMWFGGAAALALTAAACSSSPGASTGQQSSAASNGGMLPDAGMTLDAGKPPPPMDAGMTQGDGGGNPMCSSLTIGDGKSCLDPMTIEEQAEAACKMLGLELSQVISEGATMECPGGTIAQAECCDQTTPPPPPPPKCEALTISDGGSCLDSNIKQEAIAICSKLGLPETTITIVDADESCRGGTLADVQCCSEPPPPPPPPMCTDTVLGDGKTCLDPDTLKADAAALCMKLGLVLEGLSIKTSPACPGGVTADVTCCAQ